jgi:hypothetical protein
MNYYIEISTCCRHAFPGRNGAQETRAESKSGLPMFGTQFRE